MKFKVTRFVLGANGLEKIDVPDNSLKNNLKPGAVLHWAGHQAWPSQNYAIVRRDEGSFGVYYDAVSLEDFSAHRLESWSIALKGEKADGFSLTEERLSDDELLDLMAKAAAKKRADDEAASAKSAAFKAEKNRLREDPRFKDLIQLTEANTNALVTAAKNIRKELKKAFPKTKFTVRTERYSGGDSINVGWTDGPPTEAVKKISDKYQGGDFDGMIDLYEYRHNEWTEVFGDAKYVFENRKHSRELLERAIKAMNFDPESVVVKGTDEVGAWLETGPASKDHQDGQARIHWVQTWLNEHNADGTEAKS